MIECDYLIVGGGTAGAVLAARLSEDSGNRVVLVEAGGDIVPGAVPADVNDLFPLSTFNPAYMWPGLNAHWRGRTSSPAMPFQQGRVIGGGSTIMGMWALRGVPEDYDGWAAAGAAGWGWDEVTPFFRRLETDHDFGGPLHGRSGPIPIRRQPRDEWSPLARAVAEMGDPVVEDMNADFGDGCCVLPISRHERSRASAGLCYLTSDVRARLNLRILTETVAERLDLDGRRVTGATVRQAGRAPMKIAAGRTVLCAGAIYTPLLLMRSGVGPGAALRSAGIAVRHDLPGVGENLQNHPLLPAFAWLRGVAQDAGRGRPPASTYLRWSSGVAGAARGDMGMYVRSYLAWHALGRRMAMVGPVIMRPMSRGNILPTGPGVDAPPSIAFNFLSHPADEERLVSGMRRARGILEAPQLQSAVEAPFAMTDPARLGRFNALSVRNEVLAGLAAALRDRLPRRAVAALGALAGFRPLSSVFRSEAELTDFVRAQTIGTNHVCGTARMGRLDDPMAVAAPDGRVHGLSGLVVADASLMPNAPSGNTHIPVVMLAEKLAAGLAGGTGANA